MAKFLNTSATNYFLEELIKSASERLILISPYLKLNDRIKELLEDKNRLKIDVRIIYGKNELQNDEINWLSKLSYIRTSFCKNLHAKCYINEENCIITSLNLYEFSQVNNNEMGVVVSRSEDIELYKDAYEEAKRIIRISDEVRISLEKVIQKEENILEEEEKVKVLSKSNKSTIKLSTSKLATKLRKKTDEFIKELISEGYVEIIDEKKVLTEKGIKSGAENKKGRYGEYFVWCEDFII